MVEVKRSRPTSMSFFDLFITPKPPSSDLLQRHATISRDRSGRPALIRTRKKVSFNNCIRRVIIVLA